MGNHYVLRFDILVNYPFLMGGMQSQDQILHPREVRYNSRWAFSVELASQASTSDVFQGRRNGIFLFHQKIHN